MTDEHSPINALGILSHVSGAGYRMSLRIADNRLQGNRWEAAEQQLCWVGTSSLG